MKQRTRLERKPAIQSAEPTVASVDDRQSALGAPERVVGSPVPTQDHPPERAVSTGLESGRSDGHRFGQLAIVPPNPTSTRLPSELESRFGASLGASVGQTQILTGPGPAALASGMNAAAVTVGHRIHFAEGQFRPDSPAGQGLLAHEAVHVAQQAGATGVAAGKTPDALEAEATELAPRVARGLPTRPSPAPAIAAAAAPEGTMTQAPPVAGPPVQGGTVAPVAKPAGPADVSLGFNPMDRRNKLLRAINQSQVEWKTMKRHVNFDEVLGALSGLTLHEAKEVKRFYDEHEHPRNLEVDLYGLGESGFPSDLTSDQILRLMMLMGGTRSAPGAVGAEKDQAVEHQRVADAAELHQLLLGDRGKDQIERVMQMLRHDAKTNALLGTAYERLYHISLLGDLIHLGPVNMIRAQQLYMGLTVNADRFDVSAKQSRIGEIDRQLAKVKEEESSFWSNGTLIAMQKDRLQKERQALVDGIEQRTQESVAEARDQALSQGGDAKSIDTAAHQRAETVMGDSNALATTLGGADAMVVRAIVSGDPVAKTVAELRKSVINDKISAEQITSALRGLRQQAEQKAQLENPKLPPDQVKEKAKALAEFYFARLKAEYTMLALSVGGMSFEALIADTGNSGDVAANNALLAGRGYLSDVEELVVALAGSRKDTATVERVLKDKSAVEIHMLKVQYIIRSGGRTLDYDLFGEAPTTAGEENPEWMGRHAKEQGKASGTSRLKLEDYLQRPAVEGGLAEVSYIASRAEREYEYTIENRGMTGAWRDAWGNEERSLLDETIGVVRKGFWEFTYATVGDPKFAETERGITLLNEMRMARATIRGDREAYEKATAELRALFQQIAAFALQIALSAVLGPLAAAAGRLVQGAALAVRVAVNAAAELVVSTAAQIGSNMIAYGNEYSLSMLKGDLLGSLGGAIGPAAVGRLTKPFAGKISSKLGKRVSEEIIGLGNTVAGMEAGALLQGESIDLSIDEIVKAHAMGKASEKLTAKTKDVLGIPQPVDPRAAPHEGGGPTKEATSVPTVAPEAPVGQQPHAGEAPVAPVGPIHDAGPAPAPAPVATPEPAKGSVHTEGTVAPTAPGHPSLGEGAGGPATPRKADQPETGAPGHEAPAPMPPAGTSGVGSPDPALRPQAGPARTEARALVHGMDHLATQWPGLNGGERLQAMSRVIDPVLEARGVPPIRMAVGEMAAGTAGHFDFTTWSIRLGSETVGLPSLSGAPGHGHPGGVADYVPHLSNLVRHETDHTIQWWEMARHRASQGADAHAIAREMWIPHDIAVQAVDAFKSGGPLTGADAHRAQLWWESVYGGGKAGRDKTYTDREHFLGRLEAIEAQIQAGGPNPDPALLQIRDAIKGTTEHLDAKYRGLAEERGAYDTGDRVQGEAHVMQAETQAGLADVAVDHVREWVRDLERAITEPLAKGQAPDPKVVAEHSRALEQLKHLENAADQAGARRDTMIDETGAPGNAGAPVPGTANPVAPGPGAVVSQAPPAVPGGAPRGGLEPKPPTLMSQEVAQVLADAGLMATERQRAGVGDEHSRISGAEESQPAPRMTERGGYDTERGPYGSKPDATAGGTYAHQFVELLQNPEVLRFVNQVTGRGERPLFFAEGIPVALPEGMRREHPIPVPVLQEAGVALPRIDRLWLAEGFIIEIKPNNAEAVAGGQAQVEAYASLMDRHDPLPGGRKWQPMVVTYDQAAILAFLNRLNRP